MKPANLFRAWEVLKRLPGGSRIFTSMIKLGVPYSGTIGAKVIELYPGYACLELRDRRAIRNHLQSVHAIAILNLGELTSGLAMLSSMGDHDRAIIVELNVVYHKKARGLLTAQAHVAVPTELGSHRVVVESDITDKVGDAVATVKATWLIQIKKR